MTTEWTPIREQDKDMIHALAQVVIMDRLRRAEIVGETDSGRIMVEMVGEPTEAERMFDAMCKPDVDLETKIEGGMFSPEAKALIEKGRAS